MEKRRRRPRRGRLVARGCGSWGTRGARAWSIRRDARAPMVGAPARWTWSTGGGARRRGPRGCVRDARLASRAFARTREGQAPVRGGRSATWRRPARARVRGRVPRPAAEGGTRVVRFDWYRRQILRDDALRYPPTRQQFKLGPADGARAIATHARGASGGLGARAHSTNARSRDERREHRRHGSSFAPRRQQGGQGRGCRRAAQEPQGEGPEALRHHGGGRG